MLFFNRKNKDKQPKRDNKRIIGPSLEKNIAALNALFEDDETFKLRRFENQHDRSIQCCVFFIDGMVKNEVISERIILPILTQNFRKEKIKASDLQEKFITASEVRSCQSLTELAVAIQNGDTALLMDGDKNGLIISSKGWEKRSISEPETEKVLKGPRIGFSESLVTNLSMLRRNLKTNQLKIKFKRLGTVAQNELCICYLDKIANEGLIKEVEKRINDIRINAVLDSNYISELIRDEPLSPFKTIGASERPDVLASKLLEGRIAIIVDGSPVGLTVPHLFVDNFKKNDDYYLNYYFAGISRFLRIAAFFFSISIPAIYLGFVTFHHEMLPTSLIISLYSARQGLPFPTIIEVLLLLAAFELLREAGSKSPTNISQALSIVGAVVIGQAAVEARLVSAPMVIIIAVSAITGIANFEVKGATIIIRLLLLALTTMIGLYGFALGFLCLCFHLASMRSFGVPFLSNITGNNIKDIKDTAIRAPMWILKKREAFFSNKRLFKEDIDEKSSS